MTKSVTRDSRFKSLRVVRSASDEYISSKRSCARRKTPRWPFCSALSSSAQASPVFPTPGPPTNTMFSAFARKPSSAKVRIWRWSTPGCFLKGKDSRVHCSGMRACLMRQASALSWRCCHSARKSRAKSFSKGRCSRSALAIWSSRVSAIFLRCSDFKSCSRSSFITVLLEREDEVVGGDLLEHHALEPIEVEEAVLLGPAHRGQEGSLRVVADHLEQPAQGERATAAGVLLEAREVARELGLGEEQL